MAFTASDICKVFFSSFSLAIFLPPLGVFLERGCNADFVSASGSNCRDMGAYRPSQISTAYQHPPGTPRHSSMFSNLLADVFSPFRPFLVTCMSHELYSLLTES
ncbi:uncharacterized protein STEHIDRAFT_51974 [Stereum hirsutum FP-91666 SS1]|uniref:uncharacterized protein n=1 Tax=Stereum hirsutum (strain FP-91666) TaxID=721885 RepID=UPI000440CAD7|nr:uncharacterized protein STEHIDRAFT_51974 [Stereum hirsutum FP-91666 SS1]EIM90143.1 hypothetical protein STEHIDRAFT_51974 [Stereum hirsutum FP-91666 SS1]